MLAALTNPDAGTIAGYALAGVGCALLLLADIVYLRRTSRRRPAAKHRAQPAAPTRRMRAVSPAYHALDAAQPLPAQPAPVPRPAAAARPAWCPRELPPPADPWQGVVDVDVVELARAHTLPTLPRLDVAGVPA